MKKSFLKLAGLAVAAVLALGMSGCSSDSDSHEHTFATSYTSDATHHWHAATCEHTDQVKDKAEHSFGEWTVVTAATEDAEGKKTRKCDDCEYVAEETIAKLDHVHAAGTHHDATAGNCVDKGTIEYYDCTKETCEVKLDADGNPLSSTEGELNPSVHKGTTATWIKTAETHKEVYDCCGAVKTEETAHTWNAGVVTTPATTEAEGVKTFTCTVESCGRTKTESIEKLPPFNFYESPVDAETGLAVTESTKYIYFGVFPKTVVPAASEDEIDENTSITMGSNTYYKDKYGNLYVKVKENAYVPPTDSTLVNYYTDGTLVKQSDANSYRYFKVEPIKWKILTKNYNNTGKALLLAEDVLTANVPYYEVANDTSRTIDGKTVRCSNYKHSQIRAYLNGISYQGQNNVVTTWNNKGFLQTAFTTAAQGLIAVTTVDNSEDSTTDTGNSTQKATNYVCENTFDKIFLLSQYEVTTSAYGFGTRESYGVGNARIRIPTDYAFANYAFKRKENGFGDTWKLRSPYYTGTYNSCMVNGDGSAGTYGNVSSLMQGVVPALTMSLE